MTARQIGMKLQKLRKAQGLSRYALAKRAGISRVYVAKLEAGRSNPTVAMLERLARALRCPLADLLK